VAAAGGVGGNSISPSVTGAGGAATNIAITGTSVAMPKAELGGMVVELVSAAERAAARPA